MNELFGEMNDRDLTGKFEAPPESPFEVGQRYRLDLDNGQAGTIEIDAIEEFANGKREVSFRVIGRLSVATVN